MDYLVLKTVIFPFLTEQKKIIGKGDRKRGQDRAVRTGQSLWCYAAKLLTRLSQGGSIGRESEGLFDTVSYRDEDNGQFIAQ